MAEIIPFEPDAVSTAEGKRQASLYTYPFCLSIFSRMDIFINSEKTEVNPGQTLSELLTELKMATPKGIAIAINNNIVPKAAWENHHLHEQDRITIIRATQGG